jgi:hypothetical protein
MSFLYYATLAQIGRLKIGQHDAEIIDLLQCLSELKRRGLHRSQT